MSSHTNDLNPSLLEETETFRSLSLHPAANSTSHDNPPAGFSLESPRKYRAAAFDSHDEHGSTTLDWNTFADVHQTQAQLPWNHSQDGWAAHKQTQQQHEDSQLTTQPSNYQSAKQLNQSPFEIVVDQSVTKSPSSSASAPNTFLPPPCPTHLELNRFHVKFSNQPLDDAVLLEETTKLRSTIRDSLSKKGVRLVNEQQTTTTDPHQWKLNGIYTEGTRTTTFTLSIYRGVGSHDGGLLRQTSASLNVEQEVKKNEQNVENIICLFPSSILTIEMQRRWGCCVALHSVYQTLILDLIKNELNVKSFTMPITTTTNENSNATSTTTSTSNTTSSTSSTSLPSASASTSTPSSSSSSTIAITDSETNEVIYIPSSPSSLSLSHLRWDAESTKPLIDMALSDGSECALEGLRALSVLVSNNEIHQLMEDGILSTESLELMIQAIVKRLALTNIFTTTKETSDAESIASACSLLRSLAFASTTCSELKHALIQQAAKTATQAITQQETTTTTTTTSSSFTNSSSSSSSAHSHSNEMISTSSLLAREAQRSLLSALATLATTCPSEFVQAACADSNSNTSTSTEASSTNTNTNHEVSELTKALFKFKNSQDEEMRTQADKLLQTLQTTQRQ